MIVSKGNPRKRYTKAGRPGHWKAEMADQVYELALLGYTNQQYADFYKISVKVIEDWVVNNNSFVEARNKGRDIADSKVARSLYERAIGYEYVEKFEARNADGNIIRTEETVKKVHGDTSAALKWLALRHREKWAVLQQSEHTIRYAGEVDVNILQEKLKDKSQYSNDDLKAALKLSLDNLGNVPSN